MLQKLKSIYFSSLFKQNVDTIATFSSNGTMFAHASDCQAAVWEVNTKGILHKFNCDHPIDELVWSPNSELIYCAMLKQKLIQIWSLLNQGWWCKIKEGPLSIAGVRWAPDSHHLLLISEFHLNIRVWSLVSKSPTVIESPKAIQECVSFSGCSKYMAVAEKKKTEDVIGVYTCDTWEVLKRFSIDTNEVAAIFFSPSALLIGILETPTEKNRILFYCTDGRLVGSYSSSCSSMFAWSPSGRCVAAADCCGDVALMDSFNLRKLAFFRLPDVIDSETVVIYKAVQKLPSTSTYGTCDKFSSWELFEAVQGRPLSLASLTGQLEKTKGKFQALRYSQDGHFIASVHASKPNIVFIFDTREMKLSSVIVHLRKIQSIAWNPAKPILAVCSGSSGLDLWTPTACISCVSPFTEEFLVTRCVWCPTGGSMVLNSRSRSSILYLSFSKNEEETVVY